MAKPEMEFTDVELFAWKPVGGVEGLYERVLSHDPDTGDYTRMLRFDPSTDSSPLGVQRHDFHEEVYILDGSLHDLTLGKTFPRGTYACRPPGMPHGPWKSQDGCVALEFRFFK